MIKKINYGNPDTTQSVYDTEQKTALELAAFTAGKVDECIDLVNGVEQTAIESQDIVNTMRAEQEEFVRLNTDARSELITENQAYIDTLEASKATFETDMTTSLNTFKTTTNTELETFKVSVNTSKSQFEVDMASAIDTITDNANAELQADVDSKISALVDDGTIGNLINTQLLSDINADVESLDSRLSSIDEKLPYLMSMGINVKYPPLATIPSVYGDANYFNNVDGFWYSDASFTKRAHDDTIALQASIDHCNLNGGVPLLPDVKCLISSPIVLKSGCRSLIGQNLLTSIIQYVGAVGTYAITTEYSTDENSKLIGGFTYGGIANLQINCPTTKDRGGLDLTRFRYGFLEKVIVQYASLGAKANDSWGTVGRDCKFFYNAIGVDFGTNANSIIFDNTEFNSNGVGAIIAGNGSHFTNGCKFELNGTALLTKTVYSCSVGNSYFEANGRIVDWGTGETTKLDFDKCYFASGAVPDLFYMNTNSAYGCNLSIQNCEFATPSLTVAIVNHISGSIKLDWFNNTFKQCNPIITNSVRYDKIRTDGAISIPLTLPNGCTAASVDYPPKLVLDRDGKISLNTIIDVPSLAENFAILDGVPTYMQPKTNIKVVVGTGDATTLGTHAEIVVRSATDIRHLGCSGKRVYINTSWKR